MGRTTEDRKALFRNLYLRHMGSFDFNLEVDDVIDNLDSIGFFTAPASTRHHLNYEGGLFDHSFNVFNILNDMSVNMGLTWSNQRSPFVVGMFHDLCKCDSYVWNETTQSYQYNTRQLIVTDHGTKSLIVANQLGFSLNQEEMCCIRYHMGAYKLGLESDVKDEWNAIGRAISKYPSVLFTHTADMFATHVVEKDM